MTRKQIAKGFVAEVQSKSPEVALQELAALLITEKRTNQLDLILEEIRIEIERVAGHVSAEVTTARPLTDLLSNELASMIKKKSEAKSVDIHNVVDTSIMGGFIARTADYEIDASVRTKLMKLKGATS